MDGKRKGSVSRFINHSCEPNCELIRWNVRGFTRIGIFAIRDIAAGEPLSYDYQFDTHEEDAFKCACGAPTCRGTMAPKKKCQSYDLENLSKALKSKLIKEAKEKEKKLAEKAQESISFTGKFLPGDSIAEIRNGPTRLIFPLIRERHTFLPRNARAGNNFTNRRSRMALRAEIRLAKIDAIIAETLIVSGSNTENEQTIENVSKKRKINKVSSR